METDAAEVWILFRICPGQQILNCSLILTACSRPWAASMNSNGFVSSKTQQRKQHSPNQLRKVWAPKQDLPLLGTTRPPMSCSAQGLTQKRFAVVLTHLPSLPTGFSECFSFVFSIQQLSCLSHLFPIPFTRPLALLCLYLLPSSSPLLIFSSPSSPFAGTCKCDCSAVKQNRKTQASREPYCFGLPWNRLTREQLECNFM